MRLLRLFQDSFSSTCFSFVKWW